MGENKKTPLRLKPKGKTILIKIYVTYLLFNHVTIDIII